MLKIFGMLLPSIIKVVSPKIKSAVQDAETGIVSVYEKPWWKSKAMLGAVALVASFVGRYFGYELTGTNIDQAVEMLLALFVLLGRTQAVK